MAGTIQFQFRRGVASSWTTSNPILASGEMGIETDTNQFKIGNGTSTWNALPYGGLQGPPGTVPANGMTTDTDQDVTGVKTFQNQLLFEDVVTGEVASVELVNTPVSPTGSIWEFTSLSPAVFSSPSFVANVTQFGLTVAGAQVGSLVVVAGISGSGVAQLGYQNPIPPVYSVTATTINAVVIKAANAPISATWIDLGLAVTLTQDIAAGSANLAFEGIFTNPTGRTGTVEFGMKLNGVSLARDIKVQIGANYNQTIAMNIPLINGYSSGDQIRLEARVTDNNNNQFSLTMSNSATDIGAMRFYQVGVSGGSGVETVGATAPVTSTGGSDPIIGMPVASAGADGYLSAANWSVFNGKQSPATTLAGYGITNGVATTGNQTIAGTKTFSSTISGSINGSAAIATTVDNANSASNLTLWTGTSAQYTAIPVKDTNTLYFQTS